jgi:hypothetical protein
MNKNQMLMSNQVDKFFASKLEDHTIEPDVNAWSKIAANLPKKNKTIIWLRVAAGVAIAGISFMLWFYSGMENTIDNRVANQTKDIEAVDEAITKQEEPVNKIDESSKNDNLKEKNFLAAQEGDKENKLATNRESSNVQTLVIEEPVNLVAQVEVSELKPEQAEEFDLANSETMLAETSRPIVIVFQLDGVKKKQDPYDLDQSPNKKTGIKKVLEIANDVRTGDSPISGLRQAKEEIFAFNFKKEDKNNNK